MATDLEAIVRNLTGCYSFADKTIIAIGAGGGQLAEYARNARHVVAIDRDEAACERLLASARDRNLESRFTIVPMDFLATEFSGDVVLFEFCLHEMPDPDRALAHARKLALDVLVIDHAPGSPWEWYAGEERGVEAAWAAVARAKVRTSIDVSAVQRFENFKELEVRLSRQGAESQARIAPLRDQNPVMIPMPYRIALLGNRR